jgi:hypothetical protein
LNQSSTPIEQLGVRWLIALIIMGVTGLGVAGGWDIARFSLADSIVDPKLGPTEDQIAAVRRWRAVSGLGFYARDSYVTGTADTADEVKTRKRRDDLMQILSIRPLSSKYWLWLAETNAEAPSKLTEALNMSVVTGANEGFIMGRRGLFGLSAWEVLPAELRRRAVIDVIANPKPLSTEQTSWLREEMAQKTAAVRNDISEALRAQGFPSKSASAIGLKAE